MTGVLFCSLYAFVTNHATPTSYVICRNGFRVRQLAEVRKKVFIMFEIWIFILQKCMDSLQEAFIHSPEPCEACFITDVHTLFHVFWTVDKKHTLIPIVRLGGARTIFNITPIGFVWKRKSYTPRMLWGWVKHRLIFIFGWTNPLTNRIGDLQREAVWSDIQKLSKISDYVSNF